MILFISLILLLALTVTVVAQKVEPGCPNLGMMNQVDMMGNGDKYEFSKGDEVEISCYSNYIIPWLKTQSTSGKIKCMEDVLSSDSMVKWMAMDNDRDWKYDATNSDFYVCTDCVGGGNVDCDNGECNEFSNTCLCDRGFIKQLDEPRKCYSKQCNASVNKSYCKNYSSCSDSYLGLKCHCKASTSGEQCETIDDICEPNPCKNEGICSRDDIDPDVFNKFLCQCTLPWSGSTCEEKIECPNDYCKNNGVCVVEGADAFSCQCQAGTKGDTCQDYTSCEPDPCKNEGICSRDESDPAVFNKFLCQCTLPWSGSTCEEKTECPNDYCKNNGVCVVEGADAFSCQCSKGFSGDNCEEGGEEKQGDGCDPQKDMNCDHGNSSAAVKSFGNFIAAYLFLFVRFY